MTIIHSMCTPGFLKKAVDYGLGIWYIEWQRRILDDTEETPGYDYGHIKR